MRTFTPLWLVLAVSGCAEFGLSPEEQHGQQVQAVREWLRGPMIESCRSLPGPESRTGCVVSIERVLASLRREPVTRDEEYRIEVVKAKGVDELRRLWGPTERETWLRGLRTSACDKAPSARHARQCLEGVEKDLDKLSRPDDIAFDPPEVRAERAVARIETQKQERAIERQRQHEMDLAGQQAAGQALLGLGIGGGLFRNTTAPAPLYQPEPIPGLPFAAPPRSAPPVSCSSRQVGQVLHTDCY